MGELYLKVNHCLLALPGTSMEAVKRVMSHPQALSQCEGYLTRLGVIKEAVDDTAGAAQSIAANQMRCAGADARPPARGGVAADVAAPARRRDCAAVASSRAAELYGLTVLDRGIQDDQDNFTRFLLLSREPSQPLSGGGMFKTSIVFSLREGPGELFKALSCFALRGIDLTKIESRPMRSAPITVTDGGGGGAAASGQTLQFSYLFYVDLAASSAEANTQNALRHLQEMAPFLRVLGCYPADETSRVVA